MAAQAASATWWAYAIATDCPQLGFSILFHMRYQICLPFLGVNGAPMPLPHGQMPIVLQALAFFALAVGGVLALRVMWRGGSERAEKGEG